MKNKIVLVVMSIGLGVLFTIFILNKEEIYAKEEYLVYAFQVGAFQDIDNATKMQNNMPSSIVVKEDNLYKVYTAIYKDIDIVNRMVVYFENNSIDIILKTFLVNKDFYNKLDNYEKIVKNTTDKEIYNKVNQSILNLYLESI